MGFFIGILFAAIWLGPVRIKADQLILFLVLYLSFVLFALGAGFLAVLSDYKGMVIPNYLPLIVLGSFFGAWAAAYAGGADIFEPLRVHVLSGIIIFVVTFIMFALRIFGGGDAKLITAYGFWIAPSALFLFLALVTISGACVALAALILKSQQPFKNPRAGSWVARVQSGEAVVPYAIPIFVGVVVTFWHLDFFQPATLAIFVVSGS